jgi:hypothetical protein
MIQKWREVHTYIGSKAVSVSGTSQLVGPSKSSTQGVPQIVARLYLIILRKIDIPAKTSVLPKPGPTNGEVPLSVGPTNCSTTVLQIETHVFV